MRRVVLMFAVLAAAVVPAVAQKIETETSDRTRIVHLKTALNHLTVIEVGEPVRAGGGRKPFVQGRVAREQGICPAHGSRCRNQPVHLDGQSAPELRTGAGRVGGEHGLCRRPSASTHLEPVKPTATTAPAADFAIDH